MKLHITKRDLLFFLLGIISMITIDAIVNWEDNMIYFKEGFEEGYQKGRN